MPSKCRSLSCKLLLLIQLLTLHISLVIQYIARLLIIIRKIQNLIVCTRLFKLYLRYSHSYALLVIIIEK